MSNPYQAPPARRLERSKNNRILGGVCAGLANYLNMDPTLVRVLTVLVSLFTGVPVILYIIALFVIPEEGKTPPGPPAGYPPVTPGQQSDPVWGPTGAPWEQPQPAPSPTTGTWTPPATSASAPTSNPPPGSPTFGGTEPTTPLSTTPDTGSSSDHSPGDSTEPGDSREPR